MEDSWKMKKYVVYLAFLLVLLCSYAEAATDKVSFSSDTMQYDFQAGRFYAEGNVTIKGRDITIVATMANGDINSKAFNLSGNITIDGTWNGDNIRLSAMSATAEISEKPTYTLESGIYGSLGKLAIDCDYLKIVGDDLLAKKVHKLQDQKTGVTFSAENVKGKIDNGELTQAEAEGNIIIKGSPNKSGGVVELKGRKAIYSVERGTIVVTGGVIAKQNKRTLTADSIVFIPAINRIEAVGTQGGRPRITVDIDDEKLPISPPNAKKNEPNS
jgi:lipopolysaccharide export system protein LptA